jgi:hypothetical protein
MGWVVPVLAHAWSASGRAVEKAAVRWTRVLESVEPTWPMGIATNSTLPHCFLRTATRGSIFQSSHCVVCCILGPGKIQLLVE